ncbi:MAG: NUDIX hydrolase [Burkholderiaceae bacterium]
MEPLKISSDIVTTPPRPAASVVLLRDHAGELQVFMLRRHGLSDVLGGAYVFPGGKLDREDSDAAMLRRLDRPAADLHAALGEPVLDEASACGLWVAACRETFEEAGILLAHGATANDVEAATRQARTGLSFVELLEQMDLTLALSNIAPWTRWITPRMPSMMNKRFDTRFFVAEIPDGLTARHDDHEATESLWCTPRAVLEKYWNRELALAPPQIMSCAHLARHANVASVLEEARSRRPPTVLPEPFDIDGRRVLTYPGDELHSGRVRALPGPLRLVHNPGAERFEPRDGAFESFFA